MLKTRVIPTLLLRGATLVKGVGFDSWRTVGAPMQAVKVYNARDVDELLFLDVSATRERRGPDFDLIHELSQECFVPFSVGGGINSIEDIRRLLSVGADKVVINTAAFVNPSLIRAAVQRFGSQCIILSVDCKKCEAGRYEVYTESGTCPTGVYIEEYLDFARSLNVGELLITSIEKDGTLSGYDYDLVQIVCSLIKNIPVIVSGGGKNPEDMATVIKTYGASAVAAGSIFNFTQTTPKEIKLALKNYGILVRN